MFACALIDSDTFGWIAGHRNSQEFLHSRYRRFEASQSVQPLTAIADLIDQSMNYVHLWSCLRVCINRF